MKKLDTMRGQLILHAPCPASLFAELRPDPGLHAFTHEAGREYALAVRAAHTAGASVAVAHSTAGCIVAQIVLIPAQDWWHSLPSVYELSIETSKAWRQLGIAHALLQFCMQSGCVEDRIILAMGLDWHWDLAGTGLNASEYRAVLCRLFESTGFRALHTSEPNVAMHATNVLLARTGARVPKGDQAAFREALYIAPWLRQNAASQHRHLARNLRSRGATATATSLADAEGDKREALSHDTPDRRAGGHCRTNGAGGQSADCVP